ncbi:hypothetical protein HD806DRAFT_478108 [Xylariaceae sp. AK1471]|nr:hypothetical protein HD806DRAFT_478108 [Xylariaceae sp. AK1471]
MKAGGTMVRAGKNIFEPHQIATLVNRNIGSIKNLTSTLPADGVQYSKAASQLARLKLWAGSLGAHRESGSRSLDYRLRDASSIRKHIILLLEQLGRAIENASSISSDNAASIFETHDSLDPELVEYLVDDDESDESDLDLFLADISHVVDCLYRLSVTISNPAPHDQFSSRAGAETLSYYEHYDIRHIQEKFPQIENWLAKRLGRAISTRRQFFKYREDHHARLASGIDDDNSLTEGGDQTTIASSLPEHLKDSLNNRVAAELSDSDVQSVVSRTSYAPSLDNSEQLKVPPVPNEYLDGPFLCPFCYLMIEVGSRSVWKKHVFRDLQPYMCLDPFCLTQDHKFPRRSDWSRHMWQVHWRVWRCSCGCQQVFNNVDEFQGHLQKPYFDNLTREQQETFEKMCSKPDLKKASGHCPICTEVQIISAAQYYTHVGHHLEQLSLFALPRIAVDKGGDQEDEPEEDATQKDASNTGLAPEAQGYNSSSTATSESNGESEVEGQRVGDSGKTQTDLIHTEALIPQNEPGGEKEVLFSIFAAGNPPVRPIPETSYKQEGVEGNLDGRSIGNLAHDSQLNDNASEASSRKPHDDSASQASPGQPHIEQIPGDSRTLSSRKPYENDPITVRHMPNLDQGIPSHKKKQSPESFQSTRNADNITKVTREPKYNINKTRETTFKRSSLGGSTSSNSSNWRWNCCNCGTGNLSYTFDRACTSCFHHRDGSCSVWSTAPR